MASKSAPTLKELHQYSPRSQAGLAIIRAGENLYDAGKAEGAREEREAVSSMIDKAARQAQQRGLHTVEAALLLLLADVKKRGMA